MKRVFFLFLDGVGLGEDDPAVNPLAAANLPTLRGLLDQAAPTAAAGRLSTDLAELVPTDAHLGVPGRPQSATGQASILTGINAPQRLGEHYGPRPDDRVRAILDEGNLFRRLVAAGLRPFYCNAYPPGYFEAVNRGKRLLSAVPYAAVGAGQTLLDHQDLRQGRALSSDFTGAGWREHLGYADVPAYSPQAAGRQLWQIGQEQHFVFLEHWQTDTHGHHRQLMEAIRDLEVFDGFLAGLLEAADLAETLVIVGSDHGNVEDCSHGKHTHNPALTLLLGAERRRLAARIHGLDDFAGVICDFLGL